MKKANGLDLGICRRQVIGSSYVVRKGTKELAEGILSGVLRLPPHPPWLDAELDDWSADPYDDRNWRFQRSTLRWLMPLVHESKIDSRYGDEYLRIVRSWWEAHPPSAGPNEAWKDMAAGTRAITLSLGADLISRTDEWYIEMLYGHYVWLLDEANLGRGNHALHQHQGLFVVSSLLSEEEGQSVALDRMTNQFFDSFDGQGVNDEGSTGYHQLNLVWWSEAWERVGRERLSIPSGVDSRLTQAKNVLAHFTLPSGHLVQIGDGPITPVRRGISAETDWALSGGKEGTPPQETVAVLDRGYVLSRSGWSRESSFLAMRFGAEPGYSHAHEDRGAVWISTGGTHWLVDSGFSSYQVNDPVISYLRSPEAHNLASIQNRAFDPDAAVSLEKVETSDEYREFVLVDYRYKNARVYRRVIHLEEVDLFLVLDSAETSDSAEVSLTQRWHLASTCTPRLMDDGFILAAGGSNSTMRWLGDKPDLALIAATEGSFQGWLYPRWKTAERSHVVRATAKGRKPKLSMIFGRNAPEEFGVVASHVGFDGTITLTVLRGPSLWRLVIGDSVSAKTVPRDWESRGGRSPGV